ncbi:MAG: hypothetical protein NTY19_46825 [Planctomycetota bacterium]|nr:hypothetical protein [Planctomycetota bacterium]
MNMCTRAGIGRFRWKRKILSFVLLLSSLGGLAMGQTPTNLLTNGSFEFWGQVAQETVENLLKHGGSYSSHDPQVPVRWTWRLDADTSMHPSADAHGGRQALALRGGGASLTMSSLEVVPAATYSYGIYAKGAGKVVVRIMGEAPEGWQTLAEATGQADKTWQLVGGQLTLPRHIRVVHFSVEVARPEELVLDDAHISAPLDVAYDADAVLTKKPVTDGDTLLLADFEEDDPAIVLEGKARYVPGGRFGRALRLEKPDAVMIPLPLDKLPPEGTLEFWLSPDEVPQVAARPARTDPPIHCLLAICNADGPLAHFQADTSCTLRYCWQYAPGKGSSLAGSAEVSLGRMRKGQWTHVAATWDASAVRLYVDGVLYARTTQGPLKWAGLPTNIRISSEYGHLCWNGMVDEIRVSKIKRFGPFTPRGAVPQPLPPARQPIEEPVAVKPAKSEAELAAERTKLLGQIPPTQEGAFEETLNSEGDYVYEASHAQPLVTDGMFTIEPGKIVAGLTTVTIAESLPRLIGDPVNSGAFWKLGAIQTGTYHVGVLYESQKNRNGITEVPQGDHPLEMFLNGRVIQAGSTSLPVQVAPNVWFAELRSLDAQRLQAGDEIEVVTPGGRAERIARLILHTRAPEVGAFRAGLSFGEQWWSNVDAALRVNPFIRFVDTKGHPIRSRNPWWGQEQEADSPQEFLRNGQGQPVAQCLLANPLPAAVTVDYECVIKGHWGQVAGRDAQRITLQPHQRILREISFEVTDDDPGYSIKATVKPAGNVDLGWPEMDTISLFPGYRQSVPWHDPATASHAKRVSFKQPLATARRTLSLNGTWQRAFFYPLVPAEVPPADAQWTPTAVPMMQIELEQSPRRQFGAYFRRTFEVSDRQAAGTYRLVVENVGCHGTVFVNGRKVGTVAGSNTPLVIDVSSVLRPGSNDLLIIVRDILAVMDPAYVNPKAPLASPLYLDAPGSFSACNRIFLGDVLLEMSPAVAADDLLITTSFRQKRIAAEFSVVNHTERPVRALVKATVLDARRPVLELGRQEVAIEFGKSVALNFLQPWTDPRLWSPADPHLVVLAVEIRDAATGQILDLSRQRFGFRETWIQDADILLNGIRIKPKAVTTPSPYGADLDFTMGRGAPIPDYMDENGFMASEQLADVANSSSKHNVDRDVYWENARANVLAGARRVQNHPCIVAWDLSNEWYGFLSYSGDDPLKGARRLRSLTEVLQKQDPNRWTFYNGDEDLGGLHYAFSGHYLSPYGSPYEGFTMHGHSAYLPDGWFFRKLDDTFAMGQEVVVSPYRKTQVSWGKKLLMNTENLWKTGSLMPPGPTVVLGEDDVLSPAVDHFSGPAAWMYKQNLDGHRDLGCSVVAFYGGVCPSRRGWMLQQFIMPEMVHHGYSGSTVTRDYSLHNDLYVPAKLRLQWRLLAPDGRVEAQGEDRREMQSGDLQRGSLRFTLPQVSRRTTWTLDLKLYGDDRLVYGEQRDLEVWPKTPLVLAAPSRKVFVFDPAGQTVAVLKRAGLAFAEMQDLAPPAEAGAVLVIGEKALTKTMAATMTRLDKFVGHGGRMIVLAQDVTPAGLPVVTHLEPRQWASQVFVQTPGHPVLAGISSWDLHFWAPERIVARGAYTKPAGGAATVLANSGGQTGLEWVQLLECYRGQGLYLLCQLPLVEAIDQEPMARDLLVRLLDYAASEQAFCRPGKNLKAVVAPGSLVEKRLSEAGIALEVVADVAPLKPGDVALIDAAHKDAATAGARCKPSLAQGATLVVVGASPSAAAWLSELAGTPVTITAQPYRMWAGRGYRNGVSRLTAGLTQLDLYWKSYDGSEAAGSQAENPQVMIEPLQDYAVAAAGAREWVFPGALVEVAVGRGRLLLDQRRWSTSHEQLARQGLRNVTALALGLDVAVAPITPLRELPKDVIFRPLDLAVVANRSLTDKTPDDGQDGWPDQGENCDARTFPTGQRAFQGVPFEMGTGPRSVVVLRNAARPGAAGFPTEVTLPVGFSVEGFYFLHGSAFTPRGALGLYQVQYADGTAVDVPLAGGVNLWDWSSASEGFAREIGTRSNVAWTGSNPVLSHLTLYRMLWVNPKPEVAVKAVRFAGNGHATLMLAGVTAAVAKGQIATPPGQLAKAREALAAATGAVEAGRLDEARRLLEAAIAADSGLSAAHQALGELLERKGDEDTALRVYQAWAAAGAATPLPYNRIGEILDKRKDYQGALAAYTRSLEIEWNQPPTIAAKSRVQKLVLDHK